MDHESSSTPILQAYLLKIKFTQTTKEQRFTKWHIVNGACSVRNGGFCSKGQQWELASIFKRKVQKLTELLGMDGVTGISCLNVFRFSSSIRCCVSIVN
jgi:hypothetical protein